MPNLSPIAIAFYAALLYAAIGVVFSIPFVIAGAPRLDPAARATPLRVRILFIPGAVAVWPIMLRAWLRAPKHGTRP